MNDPSPEDLAEAYRWMREAVEELAVARRIASDPELPGRVACFHAHLAAEKALKSLQIRRAIPVRKLHNLVQLVRALPPEDGAAFTPADLDLLNPWTIDGRYPSDAEAVSTHETHRTLEAAQRVVAAVDTEGSRNISNAPPGSNDRQTGERGPASSGPDETEPPAL